MTHVVEQHAIAERRACCLAYQPRGTQRYRPTQRVDEDKLTQAIITLAGQYGRYGYRRIAALLVRAGRALAQALQYRPATLLAGISTSSTIGMAGADLLTGGGGVRFAHASSTCQIRHRSDSGDRWVTLTKLLVQNFGQATTVWRRLKRSTISYSPGL